jgi:hypothetical protein
VEAAADEQVQWIDAAAGARRGQVELHMMAFPTIVTADRERAAKRVATNFGLSPDELLRSPHALIGSVDQICAQLEHRRDRWGVSHWTVPGNTLRDMTPVIERLSGT